MQQRVQELIKRYSLQPHPEGGYYAEHYRACEQVETARGPRSRSTAIYYLLTGAHFSCLHRLLQADEVWHFYEGSTLEIAVLEQGGEARIQRLGMQDALSFVVSSGVWFGARLADPASAAYCLVGCTVSPGFDFADFEIGNRQHLLEIFPNSVDLIEAFTHP